MYNVTENICTGLRFGAKRMVALAGATVLVNEMERGRKEVEKDPQLVFGEGRGRKIAGRRESSHRPLISKCLLLRIASTLHLPEPIQADLRSYSLTLVYSRHRARALTVFGCSCIFAKCQYTPSHPSQNKRKHIRSSKARTVY